MSDTAGVARRARPTRPALGVSAREEARRLYETTEMSQADIARAFGASRSWVCRLAQRGGWVRGPAARGAMVRRLRARVDHQIEAVERMLGAAAPDAAARTLACIVRTLRELARYDAEQAARRDVADEFADHDAVRDQIADLLERAVASNGGEPSHAGAGAADVSGP